jgi:alanine transaminase
MAAVGPEPPLDEENLNPKVLAAEYAVRGAIAVRATELAAELAAGKKLPFDKVIACNIGESCRWCYRARRRAARRR